MKVDHPLVKGNFAFFSVFLLCGYLHSARRLIMGNGGKGSGLIGGLGLLRECMCLPPSSLSLSLPSLGKQALEGKQVLIMHTIHKPVSIML